MPRSSVPRCLADRVRAAVVTAAALLAGIGCGGDGDGAAALRDEPILTAPPGATELLRASAGPQGGGLVGVEKPGYVEVVWASPSVATEVVAYYQGEHGQRYGLSPDAGSGAGQQHVLSGLAPKVGDRYPAVRIVVREDRAHVVDGDPSRLADPPGGTRSYVTVRITTG